MAATGWACCRQTGAHAIKGNFNSRRARILTQRQAVADKKSVSVASIQAAEKSKFVCLIVLFPHTPFLHFSMGCRPSRTRNLPHSGALADSTSHKLRADAASVPRHIDKLVDATTPRAIAAASGAASHARDSDDSDSDERRSVAENFFGTDVSVEWLAVRLCELAKCPRIIPKSWILEKLNKAIEKGDHLYPTLNLLIVHNQDLDNTTVMRVTFGWENESLPSSVVLKISAKADATNTQPEAQLPIKMFKREYACYEWLQKQKRVCVPKILLVHVCLFACSRLLVLRSLQKMPDDECKDSVIIFEDLAERAIGVDWHDEVSIDAIRDLLRLCAQVHAASWLAPGEWRSSIRALDSLFYRQLSKFVGAAAVALNINNELMSKMLTKLTSASYLAKTVVTACKRLNIEPCVLHGNLISRNFFLANSKNIIAAIIDWTQVHPGCFAEDVAKAICWNMPPRDRHLHADRLLEYYHFCLLKYSGGRAQSITLDLVKRAYEMFVPLSAVTYLMYLPDNYELAHPRLLERAQVLIRDSFRLLGGRLTPEPADDEASDENGAEPAKMPKPMSHQ